VHPHLEDFLTVVRGKGDFFQQFLQLDFQLLADDVRLLFR
jgi:hypothetical protein